MCARLLTVELCAKCMTWTVVYFWYRCLMISVFTKISLSNSSTFSATFYSTKKSDYLIFYSNVVLWWLRTLYSYHLTHSLGKISWSRQLFRRIQEPMEIFQQQPKLLENAPESKKIIKNFNKLAKVLLEFEVLYYRGWLRQVSEGS